MNMEEQLREVVEKATLDGQKWHAIVHGNDTSEVDTENGKVPSVSKQLKDIRDEITGGISDVVFDAREARDEAIAAKNESQLLKQTYETLKSETKSFRDEAEIFKDISQTTFNNIASATTTAVSEVRQEGSTQIVLLQNEATEKITEVQTEGGVQIAQATEQANRAKAEANLVNYPIVARDENSGALEIDWSLQEDYLFSLTGAASLAFTNLPEDDRIGWFRLIVLSINAANVTLGVPSNLLYADGTAPTLKSGKIYQLAIQYLAAKDKFFVSVVEY